eukprot:10486597-Ditylum_brightwellii.AAC.1
MVDSIDDTTRHTNMFDKYEATPEEAIALVQNGVQIWSDILLVSGDYGTIVLAAPRLGLLMNVAQAKSSERVHIKYKMAHLMDKTSHYYKTPGGSKQTQKEIF